MNTSKRKLVAALACRNSGSRLYGKPLQNLDVDAQICILDNIVESLRLSQCIDEIVLGVSEGISELAELTFKIVGIWPANVSAPASIIPSGAAKAFKPALIAKLKW